MNDIERYELKLFALANLVKMYPDAHGDELITLPQASAALNVTWATILDLCEDIDGMNVNVGFGSPYGWAKEAKSDWTLEMLA